MLASAEFNSARMKEEAGKGFSTATDLADTLVRSYNIPFRTAHSIVGRAVQKGDLSPETLDDAAREVAPGISLSSLGLTRQKIHDALDVSGSIALRKAPGGPAPSAIKTALADRRKLADAETVLVGARLAKLKQAKDNLVGKARRLVA
jgi:argininosuccinate lyase